MAPGGRGAWTMYWVVIAARAMTLIGIVSLLAAAATLLVFGMVETGRQILKMVTPEVAGLTSRELFLANIKLVDLVLLATVQQVVAFGLYALFINGDIPVPAWLRNDSVDGLKSQLAGIIAVMLGVLFLELVITGATDRELMLAGLGVAAVIAALSYFIRAHPGDH
jgi:uncharacterized membrane protein YqhA